MSRRISIQYALLIILSLSLFVISATLIVRTNLRNLTEENLDRYLTIVSDEFEDLQDYDAVLTQYARLNDFLRITFVSSTGEVLADSLSDTTENHLDRPEFQDLGTVFIRHSDSLNKEMMYLAKQFESGIFLRVAIPTSNILPYLNAFLVISLVIAAGIAGLSILGSHLIARQALAPLQETADSLKEIIENRYVERLPLEKDKEMNRIVNEINDIGRLISETIKSLNVEKRKRDFILDHMDQGLCVLDSVGRIVMINRFVCDLFEFNPENLNKDYLYLFRDPQIQSQIQSAMKGNAAGNVLFSSGERFYSMIVSALKNDWNESLIVVLTITDITEIKNLEILKRDFFLNASHELKSPLTSIIGSADLIANRLVKNEEETIDLSQRIVQEANRMNRLVMDMLNLSKYENSAYVKGETPVDMSEVIRDVVELLTPRAANRRISITIDAEKVVLKSDYEQMVQLIRNLVDNSIQYGVENGHVIIRMHPWDSGFRLEVEDDGIGIPKADQNRVFERFYRVDKARSKTTGGTGLGLSIVKHICMIHQAQIQLESELGKGTRITITFPQK